MKKRIIIFLILCLICLDIPIWYFLFQAQETSAVEKNSEKVLYNNASSTSIIVNLPYPDAVVGKEFKVMGQALGVWFFEGSFPIEVLDASGKQLAMGIAKAQGDWMTEQMVSFVADIKVPDSYIGSATLVLKKDNPSGLVENDARVSFPIVVEY